jgi:hypothetical protein
MNRAGIISILLVLTCLSFNTLAQTAAVSAPAAATSVNSKTPFFPLAELREGMHGTARTVFRGNEPEEFNVEILGVLPGGIGPKQDLIVGRLSGGGADRTSVFAGMSGSPVYIDGKLVGAISYSFPFSKEPICGITPIEQMIAIFEQKQGIQAKPSEPRAVSFMELASTDLQLSLGSSQPSGKVEANASNTKLAAMSGQSFQPIATPLTFSGFSQASLNAFAPQLLQAGLLPVASAGGSAAIAPMKKADDKTLVGGDSVSMQLTRGDYSLAASGTVTWRDGEKIYAFGHPFLGLGSSDLPMSESHVVTVIPNVNNSFKLAVPDAMVGSMTQDRATGVFGKLGQAPKMIPVKIVLNTSRGQTQEINFEVVKDDFLTPLLLNLATFNALTANERGLGDSTIDLTGQIKIKGQDAIALQRRFTGSQASQFAAAAAAIPVSTLLRSRFDDLQIDQIELHVNSTDGSKAATLERIAVDKTQVKAGDTIEVQAFVRADSGRMFMQRIPMTIPKDTSAGPLSIIVGDGNVIQQNAALQQFVPKNLDELVKTINKIKLPDRLYTQVVRTSSGAIVGVSEMPNLPPSVLATLNNDRTAGGFKPAVQSIIAEKEIPPAEFVISGQQTLAIEVVK